MTRVRSSRKLEGACRDQMPYLWLTGWQHTKGTLVREYRASGEVCRACPALGVCTKNGVWGRRLEIRPHEATLRRHREWMATEEARALYKRRMGLPEPAFGIIKEQMGIRRFLLRGLRGVTAEWTMVAVAFNLRTLCRFRGLVQARTALSRIARMAKKTVGPGIATFFHRLTTSKTFLPERICALACAWFRLSGTGSVPVPKCPAASARHSGESRNPGAQSLFPGFLDSGSSPE